MLPLKVEQGLVTEMLIMKDQSMCCYGTSPKITEWVSVKMAGKGVKPIMDQPVTLRGDEAVLLESGAEHRGQLFGRAGFGEKAEDMSLVNRIGGRFLVGVSSEHNAHAVRRDFFGSGQELDAVHAGHLHVGHDHGIRAFVGHGVKALLAAEGDVDGELFAEVSLIGRQDAGVVVHTEDFSAHAVFASGSGNRMRKVVPRPISVSKLMRPPCLSATT